MEWALFARFYWLKRYNYRGRLPRIGLKGLVALVGRVETIGNVEKCALEVVFGEGVHSQENKVTNL